jgi:beta-lactamase regulating signal transducer with metallopeptidase domain
MPAPMQDLAAWLLTYAFHSTLFLGAAWALTRKGRVDHGAADIIWKVALVGGIVTATAQGVLDVRPAGTVSLASRAQTSALLPAEQVPEGSPDVAVDPVGPVDLASGDLAAATTAATPSSTSLSALLAFGWIAVASLLVLVYVGRRLILTGRLGDRRPVNDDRLTSLLETLRSSAEVRAPVRLTSSHAIASPVALGVGEICLPAAALSELEPEQLRAMLAHELAHLVRRDPQWLAFACLVERALFFQPLNRFAREGIQHSAEYLADEWAARRAGGVPLARALVKVAEWLQASPLGVPVAGFAEERSQLTVRVSRLLDRATWGTPKSRWRVGMIAAVALVLMTAFAPGVSRAPMLAPGAASDAVEEEARVAQGTDTGVVRAVIDRLKDDDVEVRRAAARALGRLRAPAAITPLVAALEDEDNGVREAALHALGNFERGVPAAPIRRMLGNEDPEMRYQAVSILASLRDRPSIPAITAMVNDPNEEVRYGAISALEEMDAPIADDLVARILQDRSAELRQAGAQLAGERVLVALVPALVAMLEDPSGDVRESAAEALTEMRTEASHRALRLAITHRDARVRRIAVEYLGEDGDK